MFWCLVDVVPEDIASLASPQAWTSPWDSQGKVWEWNKCRQWMKLIKLNALLGRCYRCWVPGPSGLKEPIALGTVRGWVGVSPVYTWDASVADGREWAKHEKLSETLWCAQGNTGTVVWTERSLCNKAARMYGAGRKGKASSQMPSLPHWGA